MKKRRRLPGDPHKRDFHVLADGKRVWVRRAWRDSEGRIHFALRNPPVASTWTLGSTTSRSRARRQEREWKKHREMIKAELEKWKRDPLYVVGPQAQFITLPPPPVSHPWIGYDFAEPRPIRHGSFRGSFRR